MKRVMGLIVLSIQLSVFSFQAHAVRPDSLALDSAQQALLDSIDRMFTIQEVVVTAEEATGRSSASVINKEAMQHLQPSTFTDLTNLLPGASIKDPKLTNSNTIHLREAGDGSSDDNYATGSLGTSFVIDGAPVSTDANMQYVQGGSTQDAARQTVNKGVDMRTISTDDIEKVEIIRGIANAEYGDVTSGVVKIERSIKPTPWKARFKADGFSKLAYVGKGVGWNDNTTILYAGIDYLSAKNDPTNTLENYRRINASLRLQQRWSVGEHNIRLQSNADYSGNIDTDKNDPDIHLNKEDSYRSELHKIGLNNTLNWSNKHQEWWAASLLANISGEISTISQTRFIQLTTPVQPILDNMTEGNTDAELLPPQYVANHRVEGRPLNVYIRPKASFTFNTWMISHKADAGIEWKYDKNFGRGQVYDLKRPLNYSTNLRPRAYYDIPATNQLAWYIQDDIHIPLGGKQKAPSFDLGIGLRGTSLLGLDKSYTMHGKCYLDPRVNVCFKLPVKGGELSLTGAYGIQTKMPTLLQLYPNMLYEDLKAPDQALIVGATSINIHTHLIDPTNTALSPARNHKWEVRFGGDISKHKFSVTYFEERMRDGFRTWRECVAYTYPIYSADGTSSEYTKLLLYPVTTNGSSIKKQGVEWQYQSPRIKAICTRFTINGAWLRTEYSNSLAMYSTDKLTQTIGDLAVKDKYIGLYEWNDGTIRENMNTNIIADVYLKKIGLTVSATFELSWFTATQTLFKNGVPTAYMSADDGLLHPYDDAAKSDPVLQWLTFKYNEDVFRRKVVPFAGYLNLRVQKTVTKFATVALYVNKLLDYLPDYEVDGIRIHRSASPYFGMEINVTI
ncbi:MAG: TonB-dependent receptor plug domain-containing protein [Paludibacteraceae bacterium]|nr:TonB-dependent receptor plug domain-containing protein [Paludibacteraceae bacterium]